MKTAIQKGLILLLMAFAFTSVGKADFNTYSSFDAREGYFGRKDEIPEYYRPRSMNPLIASLPEYSLTGPGYICDNHQAPPVYRLPLQWSRNNGYREADWFNNRLWDKRFHQANFGGYDY